jgi:hypothetical protein
MAHLRQVMLGCVSDEDVRAIVQRQLDKAREGDTAAARLVLAYVVGKPAAPVDPDRLDVEEMKIYQEEVVNGDQLEYALSGLPASMTSSLLRATLPVLAQEKRKLAYQTCVQFEQDLAEAKQQEEEEEFEEESDPSPDPSPQPPPRSGEGEQEPEQISEALPSETDVEEADDEEEALPSVKEILAYRHLLDFALGRIQRAATAQVGRATDANGGETVCRAANPPQSVSATLDRV